jgi:putative flippase GtrA
VTGDAFIRYAGVGAIGTAVHYGTLISLVQGLGTNAVIASAAGFVIGAFVNYALNREFTFASDREHRVALPRFFSVAGAGLLLNAIVMAVMLAVLPLHYMIAQVVATALVLVTGFLANRRWTF